jgi:spermidine synthase
MAFGLRRGVSAVMSIPFFMFFMGAFAMVAQMTLMRELLAVFSGNELTLGATFGVWFVLVGVGALCGQWPARRYGGVRMRMAMAVWIAAAACLLPGQLWFVALARGVVGVPVSLDMPLGGMLGIAAVALWPTTLAIGAAFPCACRVATDRGPHAVSRVYAGDAAGGLAGGLAFAFLIAPRVGGLAAAFVGSGLGLAAAAAVTRRGRIGLALVAAAVLVGSASPGVVDGLSRTMEQGRWRAFGVLNGRGAVGERAGAPVLKIVAQSRYQQLAVIEIDGQNVLYGNGRILFSFPDPLLYEHRIHASHGPQPGRPAHTHAGRQSAWRRPGDSEVPGPGAYGCGA